MTRLELKNRFRQESPEVTDRVIGDTVLDSWLLEGNVNFATRARLIVGRDDITVAEDAGGYENEINLSSEITKFYDIDDWPGGGVAIDDDPITKKSIAQLDHEKPGWRTADSATPNHWYRWGKYLGFDCNVDEEMTATVFSILIPDDFDDDTITPFNELTHLEPFHYGLVLYLTMRAKFKIGKPQEKLDAQSEYENYIAWVKKEIGGGKQSAITFKKSSAYS